MNSKPNVILIIADDLGYGDIGIFGNEDVRTPNLDRLALEGVRLTQHYSASPMCSPARAALMTGKYPHRTGSVDVSTLRGFDRIDASEQLMSNFFKSMGYHTGLVGKWHNGRDEEKYHPLSRGFDDFFGYTVGASDYWKWVVEENGNPLFSDGTYLTDVLTERAVSFIDRHHNDPFFLMLAYSAPHAPLQAHEEDIALFSETGKFTTAVNKLYGMVKRMDDGIGKVMEALENYHIDEQTIVLFVSDNGPDMRGEGDKSTHRYNGHFHGSKGMVLEGGIRVPGILKWHDRLQANTVCDIPVHFIDWLPTLLEAVGDKVPDDLDGRSLWSAIQNNQMPDRIVPYFWQWNRFVPIPRCNMAIRDGDWKLYFPAIPEAVQFYDPDGQISGQMIRRPDLKYDIVRDPVNRVLSEPRTPMLFNLSDDPYEKTDVSVNYPHQYQHIMNQLDHWFDEMFEQYKLKHAKTRGSTI